MTLLTVLSKLVAINEKLDAVFRRTGCGVLEDEGERDIVSCGKT